MSANPDYDGDGWDWPDEPEPADESAEEFTDYWYRMEKGGYGDD